MSLPMQIVIALIAGIALGLICYFAGLADFTASYLKPFGTIFVNLLKFLVVPVVLLSMIDGIISMGDMKKVGSVGWKTLAYFLVTTAIACIIGLVLANIFNGAGLFPVLQKAADAEWTGKTSQNFMDTLVAMFPSNMWSAFVNADMLQVIIISLLLGGGILAAGERCVSSTNRNFVGRMGDPTSEVYLASPAVCAASAVAGHIALPSDLDQA